MVKSCAGHGVIVPVLVTGEDGIGKSELVVAYAHQHREFYDGNVVWVDASTVHTMRGSFINLIMQSVAGGNNDAPEYRLGELQTSSSSELMPRVCAMFTNQKVLFIFDNLVRQDSLNQLMPSIPVGNKCQAYILATRRTDEIGEAFPDKLESQLHLGLLKLEEVVAVILLELPGSQMTDVARLAICTGRHPRSLQKVCKVIQTSLGPNGTGMDIAEFLYMMEGDITRTSGAPKNTSGGGCGAVVGIVLGTTYSCVGVYQNGRVEIIANEYGNRITPSCVAFTAEGERLVGEAALDQLTGNPKNTIVGVKRLMGRDWSEPVLQADLNILPFDVVEKNGRPYIQVLVASGFDNEGRSRPVTFAPEEISAMILGKMKEAAETFLGKAVSHAVITVPAYFNDAQRQATMDAGTIAGLNVMRIINEPTAAALAYRLDKVDEPEPKMILVFDLGGGTFDVSLLLFCNTESADESVPNDDDSNRVFQVIATSGDTHLGGMDFDQRIVDYLVRLCNEKLGGGKDISKDHRAIQKLRRSAEKAKRVLSSAHQTRIEIESFLGGEDFSVLLTRAKLEELNEDLFRATLKPIEEVLKGANAPKDEVSEIVLVGGSTRIPRIQQLVKEFFGGRKELLHGINPDEAVAEGAAIQAEFSAFGEECLGKLHLLEITPRMLGVETVGGVMTALIPRFADLPARRSQIFSTASDNQSTVTIKGEGEGESLVTKDNRLLGKFQLTGIPLAPTGVPRIEVTFKMDHNSILQVSAEDQGTGNTNKVTITRKGANRINGKDMARMKQNFQGFVQKDKEVRDRAIAWNELEEFLYSLRQQSNEEQATSHTSEIGMSEIQEVINDQIKWLESNPRVGSEEYTERKKHVQEIVSGKQGQC